MTSIVLQTMIRQKLIYKKQLNVQITNIYIKFTTIILSEIKIKIKLL